MDTSNPQGEALPLSLPERITRLENSVVALAKTAEMLASSGAGADPGFMAKVKFVMEKFFPHDNPGAVVARKPNEPQKFVPMIDAAGHQVFDQVTGNPVFRPADPMPQA